MHGHIFAGAESIATIANSETSDVLCPSSSRLLVLTLPSPMFFPVSSFLCNNAHLFLFFATKLFSRNHYIIQVKFICSVGPDQCSCKSQAPPDRTRKTHPTHLSRGPGLKILTVVQGMGDTIPRLPPEAKNSLPRFRLPSKQISLFGKSLLNPIFHTWSNSPLAMKPSVLPP